MRSKFSYVRSSHDMCARAHVHSLEGTLLMCAHISTESFLEGVDCFPGVSISIAALLEGFSVGQWTNISYILRYE